VHRFASPWDRTLRITTWIVALVFAAVAIAPLLLALATDVPGEAAWFLALAPLLFAGTLALVWAYSPAGFALERGRLLVLRRGLRPLEFPLSSVRTVGELAPGALGRPWRVGGSSGFFGYFGRFHSRSLGPFRMYATRSTGHVAVRTADELLVLTPEPPRAFVEALLAQAGAAREAAPEPVPGRPGALRRQVLAIVALSTLVPLAAVGVALGIGWARAPRSVRVEAGAVVVERNRWEPVRIPLAEVRHVERLHPSFQRGWRRVSGYSSGATRYGTFRAPELGTFQLYAYRRGDYAVLDLASGRVVVTPDDPPGFVGAVEGGMPRGR